MNQITKILVALASVAFLAVAFQNCSGADFIASSDSGENAAINSFAGDGSVEDDVGGMGGDSNDPPEIEHVGETIVEGLIELIGTCTQGQGAISILGDIIGTVTGVCEDGEYKICARLKNTGANSVTVTQTSTQITVSPAVKEVNVFTTFISVEDRIFEFETVKVLSATKGRVTVKCQPGAVISSEIYGIDQIGNVTCTASGKLTFDIKLVSSLVDTGQRVVTVRQVMETGLVTEIFIDVDNVVSTHTCSIDDVIPNTEICTDSSGTIKGTCKAGLPLSVEVDGEAQLQVVCRSDGTFEVDNVLIGALSSSNNVTIVQNTPFSTSACTATHTFTN